MTGASPLALDAIDHVVFTVADVGRSARWYQDVLGMRRVERAAADGSIRTSVHVGSQKINLRPASETQERWFTGTSPQVGSDDICFLTGADPADTLAALHASGVEIERGPITRQGALGPICSIYIRDPDGNLIEIARYTG